VPKSARAAAIYARISSDPDGTSLGVTRQVDDCRRLADGLGWSVAEEYVDNDLSAWGAKRRPAYERMLDDLAGGRRDGMVVYHQDRLTRRPAELEHFVRHRPVATTEGPPKQGGSRHPAFRRREEVPPLGHPAAPAAPRPLTAWPSQPTENHPHHRPAALRVTLLVQVEGVTPSSPW